MKTTKPSLRSQEKLRPGRVEIIYAGGDGLEQAYQLLAKKILALEKGPLKPVEPPTE